MRCDVWVSPAQAGRLIVYSLPAGDTDALSIKIRNAGEAHL
jgi:hypothetical protein